MIKNHSTDNSYYFGKKDDLHKWDKSNLYMTSSLNQNKNNVNLT